MAKNPTIGSISWHQTVEGGENDVLQIDVESNQAAFISVMDCCLPPVSAVQGIFVIDTMEIRSSKIAEVLKRLGHSVPRRGRKQIKVAHVTMKMYLRR